MQNDQRYRRALPSYVPAPSLDLYRVELLSVFPSHIGTDTRITLNRPEEVRSTGKSGHYFHLCNCDKISKYITREYIKY